jgi:chromate transporter
MMMPLIKKRDWTGIAIMAAVFVAIGVLRFPLAAVLLASIPLSIGISFAMARKASA